MTLWVNEPLDLRRKSGSRTNNYELKLVHVGENSKDLKIKSQTCTYVHFELKM